MVKGKSKSKSNRVNTNYQTLQLLTYNEEFQKLVKSAREELSQVRDLKENVTLNFSKNGQDFYLNCKDKKLNETFQDRVNEILKKFKLPKNFNTSIAFYIVNSLIASPATNFDTELQVNNGKVEGLSFKTYARLTKKEKELRNNKEIKISNVIFDDNILKKPHRNIERDFLIAKEMAKRVNKFEERPDHYLQLVKEQYGIIEFERVKKLNPGRVQNVLLKYTSEDVAMKIFGNKNKASLVRKAYERFKNKID